MRSFLIGNGPVLIWAITVLEALLGYIVAKKTKSNISSMTADICIGLAIDAFIQAIGIVVGAGVLLQAISQLRYFLHGILVPLLIPLPFYALGWMKNDKVKKPVLAITFVVIILGILMGALTKTKPVEMAGILRYAQASDTPAFASTVNRFLSIGGVFPLILLGLVHLFKNRSPWVFLSGFFMFAFSALAPATGNMDLNFLITLFGELLMVFFLTLECRRLSK